MNTTPELSLIGDLRKEGDIYELSMSLIMTRSQELLDNFF